MTGILFSLFVGAAIVFVVALVIIWFLVETFIALAGTVFGWIFRIGILSLQLIVIIVATVIIWKLVKRGWKEFQEIRRWMKKNKEIKERMKQQAMRK